MPHGFPWAVKDVGKTLRPVCGGLQEANSMRGGLAEGKGCRIRIDLMASQRICLTSTMVSRGRHPLCGMQWVEGTHLKKQGSPNGCKRGAKVCDAPWGHKCAGNIMGSAHWGKKVNGLHLALSRDGGYKTCRCCILPWVHYHNITNPISLRWYHRFMKTMSKKSKRKLHKLHK